MQMSIVNQKNTKVAIKNLETQISQLEKQLDDQLKGVFNANTQTNSKEHFHSIIVDKDKKIVVAKGQGVEEPNET